MAWIGNKNVYNMAPQTELIECRKIFETSDKVNTSPWKPLKVEFTIERQNQEEVKIQSGIFQGDSLTPLLFCYGMEATQKHRGAANSQEKTNQLMYTVDCKIFIKNEKE